MTQVLDTWAGPKGLGWVPDLPDIRDAKDDVAVAARIGEFVPKDLPTSVSLRQWFSAVEDQKELGSCTAHAGVGILEYFARRRFGKHVDLSRRFLYKLTRKLLGWTGDTGAFLRTTMKAMTVYGAPPESNFHYNTAKYEEEPAAWIYPLAQRYRATSYYRLDTVGRTPQGLIDEIKRHLAAQIPVMFGFTVYSSFDNAVNGVFPIPTSKDSVVGGHAIVITGYGPRGFEIRNSWGTTWGDHGYGTMPYEYITMGLCDDFWVLISADWLDMKQFE